jgi:sugar lactone lactonase YvrE
MRTLLVLLAVVAAVSLAAAPAAQADASDMTCTIVSLDMAPTEWAFFNLFSREPTHTGSTTLSGSATCVHPVSGTWQATLGGTASVSSSCGFGTSSASASGTLTFAFSSGLKDSRPFSSAYSPVARPEGTPGWIQVDGPVSVATWHVGSSPCSGGGYGSNNYNSPSITGSFKVNVSKTNPKLFAKDDGIPGHPDPIAVNQSTGRVYVGSFTTALTVLADRPAPSLEPSRVTEYDLSGNRLRDWAINGQRTQEGHGLTGIALDATGRLYVADVNPARVVRLDPSTGAQSVYGTIPDFNESAQSRFGNRKPLPNGAAFGPDGSLYVTDTTQGVIWRIPAGGGTAQKWFSDPRLVSFIGPNGIRLMADQKTLLFVVSNSQPPGAPEGLQGKIYKLPITTTGAPGALSTFWTGGTNEGPDSLAIAQSGNVYVAEAGDGARTGFVVLSPAGRELARRQAPVHRLSPDIAYDTVADVAFVGTRVLFTNSANFTGNVANMAIFEYDVGDTGLPVLRPSIP